MKEIRENRDITGNHAFLIHDASPRESNIREKYRDYLDDQNKPDANAPGLHIELNDGK